MPFLKLKFTKCNWYKMYSEICINKFEEITSNPSEAPFLNFIITAITSNSEKCLYFN